MRRKIELRDMPEALETLNAILSNGGIAEVKVEPKRGLSVVEIQRSLKHIEIDG